MLLQALFVLAGLVLLPLGAEGLVRGSTGLALRLGVTALAVGLTVVAFGTGSPELVLSIQAASAGNSGIALGNVVGSNISNIALVLGLAALVRPMKVQSALVRREVPIMIVVTLVLVGLLADGMLSRLDGFFLVLGAFLYTVLTYLAAKRGESGAGAGQFDDAYVTSRRPVWLESIFVLLGLGALLLGAQLLLEGAVFFAATWGVSQVVIGLTVVALGTSLPELATSLTSALRDKADVAFGNVIGSNVLNILAVLGTAALIRPFGVQGLRTVDLFVLVLSAVALLPLMRRGWVINRWEGATLLVGYVLYIYSLVA
jgi:cation:H+ antiporter